jgi:hypothetical protein
MLLTDDIIDKAVDAEIGAAAQSTAQIIDKVIQQQLGAAAGPDIYTIMRDKPGYDYIPHCVYFYYVRINNSGALEVDHYFYFRGPPDDPKQWEEIPYDDVPGIVKELAENARPSGKKNPAALPSHNFEGITMRRKSYVAFYVDERHWLFHKRADDKNAMVYSDIKAGQPNYSFFDANDVEVVMPIKGSAATDTRTGIFMINHMKRDANGNDLVAGDALEFAFDMFFGVSFVHPTSKTLTVIFDPGGTNQGPPEKP